MQTLSRAREVRETEDARISHEALVKRGDLPDMVTKCQWRRMEPRWTHSTRCYNLATTDRFHSIRGLVFCCFEHEEG